MSNRYFNVHNGLVAGGLTVDGPSGNLQTTGVLSSTNVTLASNTITGALIVAGGAGIGQNLYVGGNIYSSGTYLVLNTGNISSYAVTQVNAGTDTAVAGTVGTITVWNTSTLQSITNRGAITNNAISITNASNSTSTSVGQALLVTGGAGIQGNLAVGGTTYLSGDLYVDGTQFTINKTNIATVDAVMYLNNTASTAALANNSGVAIGSTSSPYITWYYDGSLINGAPNWVSSGGITVNSTATFKSTAASSSSVAGNSLQVLGGIGVTGNSFIGGNLTVAGTINATISGTTAQSNNLNFGNTGTLVYQSAPSVSAFLAPGTAGYVLISNGSGNIPGYVSPASLSVGTSTNVGITNTNATGPFFLGLYNTSTTGNAPTFVDGDLSYNASTNVLTAGQFSGSGAGLTSIPNSALNNSSITVTGGTGITTAPASGVVALGGTITINNVGVTQFLGGTTGLTSTNTTGTVTLTGTLGTANGGTNNTTIGAAGTVVYSDGTKYNFLSSGTVGQILVQGTNSLAWSGGATLSVGTATNVAGGAANQLVYQTGGGATGFIGTPTSAGQLLQWNGSSIVWATTGTLFAGNATTATNIGGGFVGGIPYQQLPGLTGFIATGTVGTILQTGANGTATFVSTSSIAVAVAGTATNLAGGNSALIPIQVTAGQTAFISSGSVGSLLVQGINTATWQNTSTIVVGYSGTATNSAGGLAGQISIQTGPGQSAFIPAPTAGGQLLVSIGTTSATFVTTSSIAVAVAVTATNIAGGANGNIVYQTAAGLTAFIPAGGAGTLLQSNGTTATYVAQSTLSVGTATNIGLGAAGQIPIQTAAGATAFIPAGASAGQLLQWQGGNTATWVSTGSLTAGIASSATNIQGGAAGQIVYQTAPNVTGFSAAGTAGQVLVSNGTTAPLFQSTLTLASAVAATSTNTGALQVVGGIGIGGNVVAGGQFILGSSASSIVQSGPVDVVGTSAVAIDTFSTATYRSAKYIVSVSNTYTGLYQTTEALVIHNGTSAFIQESSVVSTSGYGLMMNFDAVVVAGNVQFQATGVANTNTVRVLTSYIII